VLFEGRGEKERVKKKERRGRTLIFETRSC
jgi:hypothetical protein